ncbi:MAG TPA: hypothetical protein VNW06_11615 [Cytophagaceae bacterium]|jgi:uncharacterized protein YjbJ (UPF0337 family)|nr:hypothetical protein [Cytophagaceae bacterium]
MTTSTIMIAPSKGRWYEQKGKLKEEFPILTDDDLYYEEGKKNEMLTNVRIKLGKTKEEFSRIMVAL